MNALVSLDGILGAATDLRPTTLFGTGHIEVMVSAIEKDVRAELFDIETEEGRERIKSVAYKIARSKTTLDEIGKEHVAAIKAQTAAIDKERKTLRDRLDALKDEIRKPVTEWETAEANRIKGHEGALCAVIESGAHIEPSPVAIRFRIETVAGLAGRDWQEFKERADAAVAESLHTLNDALAAAEQRERDAAELEALRKEKAERDRKDAERAAAEREAALEDERKANEAIRAARAEEEKAAAVARAVEQERMRAERDKAAAIEAEQRRQEQETRDAAAKKAAEEATERKRQENKRHRQRIHARIKGALIAELMGDAEADRLIDALYCGDIPHVSINY